MSGGSVGVPTPRASQGEVAAKRVGRSRALANETRGEEDLRNHYPFSGFLEN
jgi:hypothetical protein